MSPRRSWWNEWNLFCFSDKCRRPKTLSLGLSTGANAVFNINCWEHSLRLHWPSTGEWWSGVAGCTDGKCRSFYSSVSESSRHPGWWTRSHVVWWVRRILLKLLPATMATCLLHDLYFSFMDQLNPFNTSCLWHTSINILHTGIITHLVFQCHCEPFCSF